MARDIEEPTRTEVDAIGGGKEVEERHPAWVMVGASRVSSGGGAVLFDSEIQHQHFITVRLSSASRRRTLNRDWLHPEKEILEFAMSEAQWASFVSSMNSSGVPATLLWRDQQVPGFPFEPRLQESMNEVRSAAEKALENVRQAFATYKERPIKANLRHLEAIIDNLPSNMTFAAKSLSEHAENTVQKARADIEAFVIHKAEQLGLEPGDLGMDRPALGPAEPVPTVPAEPGEET